MDNTYSNIIKKIKFYEDSYFERGNKLKEEYEEKIANNFVVLKNNIKQEIASMSIEEYLSLLHQAANDDTVSGRLYTLIHLSRDVNKDKESLKDLPVEELDRILTAALANMCNDISK